MRKNMAALVVALVLSSSVAAHADHPHLRKLAKIAGIGALTGGVGALFMGSSLATGAAMGAGTHVGFHEAHQWWRRRHDYVQPGYTAVYPRGYY